MSQAMLETTTETESGAACSPLGDDNTKGPPDAVYSCQSSVCITAKQEAHSDDAPPKQASAEPFPSPSPLRSHDPSWRDEFGLLCSDGCFEPAEDVRVDSAFIESFIEEKEEEEEEEEDDDDDEEEEENEDEDEKEEQMGKEELQQAT